MLMIKSLNTSAFVALRKESVDRNVVIDTETTGLKSLSARRAWIEISALCMYSMKQPVALRKESVDRNGVKPPLRLIETGRSPQGERG